MNKDAASTSPDQLYPDPEWREKTFSPHDTEKGKIFVYVIVFNIWPRNPG